MQAAESLCQKYDAVLILDEIQSGYGRSGKFFAHQYAGIKPDVISVAKGMGNGYPIGGILISPKFKSWYGMLGTTFGGNYLACAAGIAVLDIMKNEKLVENAAEVGNYLLSQVSAIPQIKEVRGRGLMVGLEFDFPITDVRKRLLFEEKIFTGVTGTNTIRILPPLTLTKNHVDHFIKALKKVLN
jgi:acetylornithine aminotransferase